MTHRFPKHFNAEQVNRYAAMLNASPVVARDGELEPESKPERLARPDHRRCKYVGEKVGETQCRACSGMIVIPTRLCELHGVLCVTAMRQPAGDVRWCLLCDDHDPEN